jgi:hypothetical protein
MAHAASSMAMGFPEKFAAGFECVFMVFWSWELDGLFRSWDLFPGWRNAAEMNRQKSCLSAAGERNRIIRKY